MKKNYFLLKINKRFIKTVRKIYHKKKFKKTQCLILKKQKISILKSQLQQSDCVAGLFFLRNSPFSNLKIITFNIKIMVCHSIQ
jgi:hypothetical protein